MAKAILEFDLDNIEDFIRLKRMMKADDMANFIFHVTRNLKKKCDNICESGMSSNVDVFDGVELVFSEISKLIDDNDINIGQLPIHAKAMNGLAMPIRP